MENQINELNNKILELESRVTNLEKINKMGKTPIPLASNAVQIIFHTVVAYLNHLFSDL